MSLDRRSLLKGAALAGAGASVAAPASASSRIEAPPHAAAMLYDATKCIGCKACVVACKDANGMPPETEGTPEGLWDAPRTLSGKTRNIIKLYREGDELSYVKAQCMHCIDPACANACMIGALSKRDYGEWQGVVTWDGSRCIGCRYCQVACPFNIPKFQWDTANPKIVKCEMCSHLLAEGKQPACCEVCPREAVIFGSRDELLAEAHRRLEAHPDRYQPRVYGERDAAGTQVLYLSHVDFAKLGLPEIGEGSVPEPARTLQHGIYQGFITPAALYAVLGVVLWRNRRVNQRHEGEEVD